MSGSARVMLPQIASKSPPFCTVVIWAICSSLSTTSTPTAFSCCWTSSSAGWLVAALANQSTVRLSLVPFFDRMPSLPAFQPAASSRDFAFAGSYASSEPRFS